MDRQCFPTSYFLVVKSRCLHHDLGLDALAGQLAVLALFAPILVIVSAALLHKQER